MTIKFNGITKHGRLTIAPSVPTAFDDPHAEEYCIAMGWAEQTNEEAVVTYPEGSFEVDPNTIFADGPKKGQPVLPELAKAASEPEATPSNEAQEA